MRYLLAVLLLLQPGSACAVRIGARLTSSLHSWEGPDGGSAVAFNTIQQLVSLDVTRLAVKGLSFHAYGRGSVHAEGPEATRRLALYSTYADWRGIGGRLDLRLGRQRMSAGVGRGTVDGTRAIVSLPRSIALLGYVGIAAPQDRSAGVGTWHESRAYGLRVSTRRRRTTVSLSFAESPASLHSSSGPDAYGDEPGEGRPRARLIGVEARSTYFTGTDVYGALEIDVTRQEAARARLSGRRRVAPGLKLSGGVDRRRAVTDSSSGAGAHYADTEVEGTAACTLRGGFELTGSYSVLLSAGGGTHRVRLGLTRGRTALSYYRRSGYGGNRDGVSAGGAVTILPRVSLRGSLRLSSYRLSEERRSRDGALESALALDFERDGEIAATLEGRVLKTKTYDYGLQLFAKVTWRFDVER